MSIGLSRCISIIQEEQLELSYALHERSRFHPSIFKKWLLYYKVDTYGAAVVAMMRVIPYATARTVRLSGEWDIYGQCYNAESSRV